jgi:Tol biopolymer transport system component
LYYSDPAWSNGGRLAVTITHQPDEGFGYSNVAVGRPPRRLVELSVGMSPVAGSPAWAPDGGRLVVVGYQSWAGGGLYLWQSASNTTVELTPEWLDGPTADDAPAWSPDGTRIAFVRARRGRRTLHVIRPDKSGLREVSKTPAAYPTWSPDSRRLAFEADRRIAIVSADGSRVRFLTNPRGRDTDPAWSPDGSTIAFVRYRSAQAQIGDIWLMTPSGARQRLLIRNAAQPAWRRG